jgi:hypothetical protein
LTPDPSSHGGRSTQRLLSTARGGLTATATLVTAVLGVVFLLIPSVRPLPRDKIEASLSVPTVESRVDLLEWARRQYPHDPRGELHKLLGHPYRASDAAAGMVVYVRLHAEGFKRRSIRLRARVYDARTRRPPENLDTDEIIPESGHLRIDAPSRASVQLLILDDFSRVPGRYFVRVEAYDDGGMLAYADSDTIMGP